MHPMVVPASVHAVRAEARWLELGSDAPPFWRKCHVRTSQP